MTDVHDKDTRSYNMSRIRASDTKPEMIVRKFLHSRGLRYRLHQSDLPGKPDIVLKKYRTVIFIHGCFWHMHDNCKYFVMPKTRVSWWRGKLSKNKARDKLHIEQLRVLGWKVEIVWECQLKPKVKEKKLEELLTAINF